jgi:hypothetical protein
MKRSIRRLGCKSPGTQEPALRMLISFTTDTVRPMPPEAGLA